MHLDHQRIVLAHGGGGQLTSDLIAQAILPALDNPILRKLGDSFCFFRCEDNATRILWSVVIDRSCSVGCISCECLLKAMLARFIRGYKNTAALTMRNQIFDWRPVG